MYRYGLSLVLVILLVVPAVAGADAQTLRQLQERVSLLVPNAEPSSIQETPVKGLYEVRYGAQLFYISADGQYVLDGELVELDTRRSLTSEARSVGRRDMLTGMDESGMVIYAPKGRTEHVITVFTDVDCPYCRRLHEEVPALNEQGVKVRYVMFPRSGEGSPTFRKMVGIWCADDRAGAMDRVKDGKNIDEKNCETPVREHVITGQMMGINGTPAILLESGDLIPGYRPAGDIMEMIRHVKSVQR
ncbi:DsbC family protein [Ectothiorhodospira lacustris]|uniref:DsbC family protein n=1 Tax=Ectothiorhodospira lacustris TaxID=2899127 RepID=UPI001EE93AD4|nr:DsbC family protein [Ectothiorhodospira lacustris]MCG5509991.1 DsbC family protein [Ectothiorhodospira lacustris]MCG5521737.1 DsbC family protein [Ectothiorhodospira lacustris]